MKIHAFGVRADEIEAFNEVSRQHGLNVELHGELLTAANAHLLKEGDGVTTLGMVTYDAPTLQAIAARGVRYLATRTIGTNHIDVEEAKRLGIHVSHAAYAPDGVADYTIMMILLCLRKYKQSLWRSQVNDYSLAGLQGREIHNLTFGVLGTGRIGATVIKDLSGFGCKILAYDVYQNEEVKKYATYTSLEEIYKQCDVITLHMPESAQTVHIVNDESIAKMKKGVVLINCARGGLMDIKALIRGIESEQIGALGLDCIENEEIMVHKNLTTDIFSNRDIAYLRQFKNVYHTQHMAFYTDAAVYSMVEYGLLGLVAMEKGEKWQTQIC